MDIILLNLAELFNEQGVNEDFLVKQTAAPPMGLLYVGQVLSDNGYSVKVYDQPVTGASNGKILNMIKKYDPKLVGFSILFDNLWTTFNLFKK